MNYIAVVSKGFHDNEIREELSGICQMLYQKDWLAACDGNVSYRLSNQEILITPAAQHKGFLDPSEICTVTIDNEVISGKPSSERLMHLEVYRQCPQAKAVIHAHPPIATAWSVAEPGIKEMPSQYLSEVILAVGRVPIVPYSRPGTQAMGDQLRPFLPECRVLILSNHGSLSWGESLAEAFFGTERLEHLAKTLMYARLIRGSAFALKELPESELNELQKIRNEIGPKVL